MVDEEKIMLTPTNQVLMQRAIALIKNIPSCISLTVCIILNSDSQRTYMTEKLAKDPCLNLSPPEKLAVVTFGTDKPKYLQYKPSRLQLILKGGI